MDLSRRLLLQQKLEDILGSKNVHFQPPPNIQMQYPAIVYDLDYIRTDHADNLPYAHNTRYLVTIIDRDPDSIYIAPVAKLPKSAFSRAFGANGLNHTAFTLYI